ncbi:MAG: dehydrogenase [Streptosporangiaceae bacterium]|nr:dehydrogenase [Streptosporangiaceae bacterium]
MRANVIYGKGDVRVEDRPDPSIQRPTDAIVRVVASCVCGSDLWPYRGVAPVESPRPIGHEFVGIVEETGDQVRTVKAGDFVIAPFVASDGICPQCRNGITTSCDHRANWGEADEDGLHVDGGQGEYVRVPWADGTLVATPSAPDTTLIPSLLTLSDVMCTGHHAAVAARVGPGQSVVVVGDGAVGLSGVLAARRLGAERIIAMSRHASRQALATEFGATDIVAERGEEGAAKVRELLGGVLADAVLECVGTKQSMDQSLAVTRPGGHLGYVGVPAGGPELPIGKMFGENINVGGGIAPARTYIPELLTDVLSGAIDPGRVFDLTLPLEKAPEAYVAMDERTAIKVLLQP